MCAIENIESLIEIETINENMECIVKFEEIKYIMILLMNKLKDIQYPFDEYYIKIFDINTMFNHDDFETGT